jgi:hypothetical protein
MKHLEITFDYNGVQEKKRIPYEDKIDTRIIKQTIILMLGKMNRDGVLKDYNVMYE